jgi:hypothetical protein
MLYFVNFELGQKYIHTSKNKKLIHNTDFYFNYKGTNFNIFNYNYLVLYQTQSTKMLKITTKIQKWGQNGLSNPILTRT